MQLSLCIVVALCACSVLAKPTPDVSHIVSPDEFEIVEALLVHEEHDDVGVEGRAANVPADILNIFTKILEVNVPKIINGGDVLAARALSVDDAPEMAPPAEEMTAPAEEMAAPAAEEMAAPAEVEMKEPSAEMEAPDMPEDMAKEMEK